MNESPNAYGYQRAFYGRAKSEPKWVYDGHGTLKRVDGKARIRMVGMGRYVSVRKTKLTSG